MHNRTERRGERGVGRAGYPSKSHLKEYSSDTHTTCAKREGMGGISKAQGGEVGEGGRGPGRGKGGGGESFPSSYPSAAPAVV